VAKRAEPFDVRILYYDKYIHASLEEKEKLEVEEVSFEKLLTESDIVSLHAQEIDQMVRINPSRLLNLS